MGLFRGRSNSHLPPFGRSSNAHYSRLLGFPWVHPRHTARKGQKHHQAFDTRSYLRRPIVVPRFFFHLVPDHFSPKGGRHTESQRSKEDAHEVRVQRSPLRTPSLLITSHSNAGGHTPESVSLSLPDTRAPHEPPVRASLLSDPESTSGNPVDMRTLYLFGYRPSPASTESLEPPQLTGLDVTTCLSPDGWH